MPKVSLIIAIYNLEKYIKECLESVLNQTFADIEIICVNDGSTDRTLEILEQYALQDSRINIINQQNQGAGVARNNGFTSAKGEYVQFLDGDDYYEKNMVEKLYNLAKTYDADISVCSSRKVDDNGNITESRNPNSPINLLKTPLNKPFSYKDFPEDFFGLIGTVPWNKIYRRKMLIDNQIEYPKLIGPHDLAFVFMAQACARRIVVIDDELINYRFNRPGSTYTYRAKYASEIIQASIIVKDFLEKIGKYDYLEKAYINAFLFAIRWETSLCSDEQYETFMKELKRLLPENWSMFKSGLRNKKINLDYLNNLIGEQKVYLWGASNFIRDILAQESEHNPNILGIIDGNTALWGQKIQDYPVFSKEILNTTSPDGIVLTVLNNNESIYPELNKMLSENYPNIKLLPNLWES